MSNNFKELYEEEEGKFTENSESFNRIQANVWGNLGVFKFAGQIIEVFLPKLFEFFVLLLGGDNQGGSDNEGPFNDPPSGPKDDKPSGPGSPDTNNSRRS